MQSQSGEFPPARNANHESRLETRLGKTGRFRGEIRPAERCDGRLVEEGKAHAGGDRANFEGALEHSTAAQLSGMPPMSRNVIRYIVTSLHRKGRAGRTDFTMQRFNDVTRRSP